MAGAALACGRCAGVACANNPFSAEDVTDFAGRIRVSWISAAHGLYEVARAPRLSRRIASLPEAVARGGTDR
jgi:hypothetical protein